ncbi:MAG: OapB/ArvB family protein [Methanobacteriota archaeon]
MPEAVNLHIVSKKLLGEMTSTEKIRYILDEVKQDKVLVLESGLTAVEETKLIERTMAEIDHDHFKGIELQTNAVPDEEHGKKGILERVMNKSRFYKGATMTVIGPADTLRTVRKDAKSLEAQIVFPGKSRKR